MGRTVYRRRREVMRYRRMDRKNGRKKKAEINRLCIKCCSYFTERTEKLPMGSIKNVVSEPIEGQDEYHMMVSAKCKQ